MPKASTTADTDAPKADAEAAAAAEQAAAEQAAPLVKARVLAVCAHGVPNSVVHVTAAELELGLAAGELDGSPEAVAYAESLVL